MRLAGLSLPVAVWVLGIVPPPRGGLTPVYMLTYTALLAALVIVDQTAPRPGAPLWSRLLWLFAELVLCVTIIRTHGTLLRPALIYLVPTSRALLMFGQRGGLILSLSVWLAFAVNIGLDIWPDRLNEYPNYLTFLLAPYALAVVLTLSTLRQAAERWHIQKLYDELQQAHAQLKAMQAQAQELAVTQERNRLAREIHDTVAHYLTVITLQLEAAEKLGPNETERALEEVRRARRLTAQCLQEVRHSVAALRARTFDDLSLPRALRQLAANWSESTDIAAEVDLAVPDDTTFAPESALALFRAAQEGLTNVQRHARATRVALVLTLDGGTAELTVQDNGAGPAQLSGPTDSGFGLLGLRERVELLGGRLSFGAALPQGSSLVVVVPVDGAP